MVQGLDKLRRRLVDEVPKKVRAEMERAMLESADLIVAGARLRVPVDEGEVRDSIRHHGVKEGRRGGLYIAITAGDRSTQTRTGGSTWQVARLLEFGTVKMPAQPYLLPAYRANRRRALARMRRAARDAIMAGG
jgi:HK97 gp10 family phage protein